MEGEKLCTALSLDEFDRLEELKRDRWPAR
jgi:hypothetical protein